VKRKVYDLPYLAKVVTALSKTNKQISWAIISSFGLKENEYSLVDDLF